jgi:hypothetical protein
LNLGDDTIVLDFLREFEQMLSIQQVNYHTQLVKKGKALPIECPFDIKRENHLVYSKINENFDVFFRCVDCESNFTLGYNSEKLILNTIDKYKNL